MYLRLLDPATDEVTKFPGSEGLHSPRVSPDGSTLAALGRGNGDEMLPVSLLRSGVEEDSRTLGQAIPIGRAGRMYSQSIWYYNYTRQEIMRFSLRDDRHEVIAGVKVEEMTGVIGSWFNITANDEPMIVRRRDVQQVYALELKR